MIIPQKGVFFVGPLKNSALVSLEVETAAGSLVAANGSVQQAQITYQGTISLFLDPRKSMEREMLAAFRAAGPTRKSVRVILEREADKCFSIDPRQYGTDAVYRNVLALYEEFSAQ